MSRMNWVLFRLNMRGNLTPADEVLTPGFRQELDALAPVSPLCDAFTIPDPARPFSGKRRRWRPFCALIAFVPMPLALPDAAGGGHLWHGRPGIFRASPGR